MVHGEAKTPGEGKSVILSSLKASATKRTRKSEKLFAGGMTAITTFVGGT
jgi:hypothetical protein